MNSMYEIPKEAEQRMNLDANITSASIGYKYMGDENTKARAVVFGVRVKSPRDIIPAGKLLPSVIADLPTDVQEREAFAPPPWIAGDFRNVAPRAFTQRRRPCPPSYSIGHYLISAGTHGLWGKRGMDEDWRIFSNNHVLANSNDARPNDPIYQPGPHDGGTSSDRIGLLEDYVKINWDGDNGGGCNILARLWQAITRRARNQIEQPYPNLVDAAVARVVNQGWVDLDYPGEILGELRGIRDLQLGDRVLKGGRTTEWTTGMVEGVGAMVRVDYGGGKVATFKGQFEIRSDVEGKDFSAGGDSGSAILTEDDYVGGLLFAGGGGVTIANRISDVVALLGLRL